MTRATRSQIVDEDLPTAEVAARFADPLRKSIAKIGATQHEPLVYFLEEEGRAYIKIGWTTDIVRRMRALQCGNSRFLTLVAYFKGTRAQEAWLHRYFRHWRQLAGASEWFMNNEPLRTLIEDIRRNGMTVPEVES